jgi:hypothetical protein
MAALFVALVVLSLLRHVPLVGGLIGFVALIAGIGALVSQAWSGRESRAAVAG